MIGRPTIGPHRVGVGVKPGCMYRYQGPVRLILVKRGSPYAYAYDRAH